MASTVYETDNRFAPSAAVTCFISYDRWSLEDDLRPLINNTDLTVKNSLEFCEQMKNVKLEEGDELLSFDVVSLFTSPF